MARKVPNVVRRFINIGGRSQGPCRGAELNFNEHTSSGRILTIIKMALESITSRFFKARAFLVFAALISLCVSNNVGPSFLPLPVVTNRLAENPQEKRHDKASRVPSPTESDNFRVPIMGQTQKRATKEPQPHPLAATLKAGIALPADTQVATTLSFPTSLFSSPLVSQPPGASTAAYLSPNLANQL